MVLLVEETDELAVAKSVAGSMVAESADLGDMSDVTPPGVKKRASSSLRICRTRLIGTIIMYDSRSYPGLPNFDDDLPFT